MAIPENYFTDMLRKYNMSKQGDGVSIGLDFTALGAKIDAAQDILDNQALHDMQIYMPYRSGDLIRQTVEESTRGELAVYPSNLRYGHYQYEGVVYEDPDYHVGGFYNPETKRWWSRPGVTKVKTDRPLKYKKETAVAHWDEVTLANHESEWFELIRRMFE